MMSPPRVPSSSARFSNSLFEAAELEHNLMCTYLYAATSLKSGEGEGLATAHAMPGFAIQ